MAADIGPSGSLSCGHDKPQVHTPPRTRPRVRGRPRRLPARRPRSPRVTEATLQAFQGRGQGPRHASERSGTRSGMRVALCHGRPEGVRCQIHIRRPGGALNTVRVLPGSPREHRRRRGSTPRSPCASTGNRDAAAGSEFQSFPCWRPARSRSEEETLSLTAGFFLGSRSSPHHPPARPQPLQDFRGQALGKAGHASRRCRARPASAPRAATHATSAKASPSVAGGSAVAIRLPIGPGR